MLACAEASSRPEADTLAVERDDTAVGRSRDHLRRNAEHGEVAGRERSHRPTHRLARRARRRRRRSHAHDRRTTRRQQRELVEALRQHEVDLYAGKIRDAGVGHRETNVDHLAGKNGVRVDGKGERRLADRFARTRQRHRLGDGGLETEQRIGGRRAARAVGVADAERIAGLRADGSAKNEQAVRGRRRRTGAERLGAVALRSKRDGGCRNGEDQAGNDRRDGWR